jgi:hypothetical protein
MPPLRLWICCLLALAIGLVSPTPAAGEDADDSIRPFDLPTIESLGRQIYEQDQIAAKGTDALFASGFTPEQGAQEGVKGWIVVQRGAGYVVRFVKEVDGVLSPAYDIAFDSPKAGGTVSSPIAKTLPEDQAAQFRARQLANPNLKFPCSKTYNTVVLPDVDGTGFLVYALAATDKPGVVMMGGHVRITTSTDGRTAERVDRLSRSCLVLEEKDAPKGTQTVGMVSTHLVSPTPVETHVFLSLLHKKPFFIGTADRTVWKVEGGKISKVKPPRDK